MVEQASQLETTILQDLLNKAYNLEQVRGSHIPIEKIVEMPNRSRKIPIIHLQEGKTEGSKDYSEIIKQIAELDPMNYEYVDKYALSLANTEGAGGLEAAQEQ